MGPGGVHARALFAAEHLQGRVAIHAGLVRAGGRTILLPGPSFAGKSTLCLAMAEAGAEVLSDEYGVVDIDTGLVEGWSRPIHRRLPDGTVERIALSEHVPTSTPVDLVAVIRYRRGTELALDPSPTAQVAQDLLKNTVSAQRSPEDAFRAAIAIARTARGLAGTRGEATAAARFLLST